MAFGLAQYNLTTITRRLDLPEISGDPARPLTLIVRFCGVGNKAWETLMFQWAAERKADADALVPPSAPDRIIDNKVLAGTVIVDWENVTDDGVAVSCDADTAAQFLAELDENCPDVWRRVLNFVVERTNFRAPTAIDAVALGKG